MLETIREYATGQLNERPEFAAATRRRHAEYFAGVALEAWPRFSSHGHAGAAEVLTIDLENLRAAWRYWVAESDIDRLNEMRDSLWYVYEAHGWYHATVAMINDLLDVLATLASSTERWQQEVSLRTSLARALMAIKGYTGEVEDAFERALALFEGQRELPQLFPVLRGLATFYQYRADFDKGVEIGGEILQLAIAQGDPSMRVDGELVLGSSLAFTGDLHAGLEHLDAGIAAFEAEGYRPRRMRLGVDPRVSSCTTSAFCLWLLGYPDRAVDRADRGLAVAAEPNHPFSLAYALFHSGFLHLWRREPAIVRERAVALLNLVDEHDFPIWRALGLCLLGAANSGLGRPNEGLVEIGRGLDLYQGLRTPPVFWPLVRFVHAGVQAQAGQAEAGLALIDEALDIAGPRETLSPEFHSLRGDLLLVLPRPDVAAARGAYQLGLEVATQVEATMSQLRAAVRLLRLERGENAASDAAREARQAVEAIYGTFHEGFDTADLKEARALIETG
jgi:hypothetical protein